MESTRENNFRVMAIQDIAKEVFGEILRMKGRDILDLADRVRGLGMSMTMFLTFVNGRYSATVADRMLYRNFLTSSRIFEEFEKHMDHVCAATPVRLQREWAMYDAALADGDAALADLLDPRSEYSPLFRFMLLSRLEHPRREDWREAAEWQLMENPYYWTWIPEMSGYFPIGKEALKER